MKVFISWSGPLSKKLAEAFRDWLPAVLQSAIPYFTPSDIEKGARWSTDIAAELEASQLGILCITRDNLHSDWILFEAGALSKRLDKAHVCPIVFGIAPTDLAGPLKQFQAAAFEKPDIQKLISLMNSKLGDQRLTTKTLDAVFDKWWPDLEKKVNEILTATATEVDPKPVRSERDLIEEILALTRAGSRARSRPNVPIKLVEQLLEAHLKIHNDQEAEIGGYQEVLDVLRTVHKPLDYLARKFKGQSQSMDDLLTEFDSLGYIARTNVDEENDGLDDEVPI